jgi:hypothetical protein
VLKKYFQGCSPREMRPNLKRTRLNSLIGSPPLERMMCLSMIYLVHDKKEKKETKILRRSILQLEKDLSRSFAQRGGQYATIAIANMDDAKLEREPMFILAYLVI